MILLVICLIGIDLSQVMKFQQMYQMANSKTPISQESWLEFEKNISFKTYKKKELLVEVGHFSDKVFVLISGYARNYSTSSSGREFTKTFRGPGSMFAPYAEILGGFKVKYVIQAIEDIECLEFSYAAFKTHMDKYHEWERLGRIIAEENFLEKEKREFMLLHMDIEQKYQEFLADFKDYASKIPQYQIASYLGVSAESLNRFLKKNS